MNIEDLINQLVEDMDFDVLLEWANLFEIQPDQLSWPDDLWPDQEAGLRVNVAEAMRKVGENAQAERDRRNKR